MQLTGGKFGAPAILVMPALVRALQPARELCSAASPYAFQFLAWRVVHTMRWCFYIQTGTHRTTVLAEFILTPPPCACLGLKFGRGSLSTRLSAAWLERGHATSATPERSYQIWYVSRGTPAAVRLLAFILSLGDAVSPPAKDTELLRWSESRRLKLKQPL